MKLYKDMKLYKVKKQFDPNTGDPAEPRIVEDKRMAVCDYTGEEVDLYNDAELIPQYYLSFRYNTSSEPVWELEGDDRFEEFGVTDDYGEFGEFINSSYHFKTCEWGCVDVSLVMIEEWMDNLRTKSGRFKDCATIESVCRAARLDTLHRLLKGKKYTPEQLGFFTDET